MPIYGGGGAPTGAAGGDLGGTYPNPTVDLMAGGTLTGALTATALKASGLTGTTAASRYVGATASGAPGSGTFAVGDFAVDQTGKVYVCTVAGTPGTWTQVGGSAIPQTREYLLGTFTSVAAGAQDHLPLDTKLSGDDLLGLTDPLNPTVVTAGVYAFSLYVSSTGMTAGMNFNLVLNLDSGNLFLGNSSGPSVAAVNPTPRAAIAGTYYHAAAATIAVEVYNPDSVARTFGISTCLVQRLS